jgi:hypothetical protein
MLASIFIIISARMIIYSFFSFYLEKRLSISGISDLDFDDFVLRLNLNIDDGETHMWLELEVC